MKENEETSRGKVRRGCPWWLALTVLALAAVACSCEGGGVNARNCWQHPDCGDGSACLDGACVECSPETEGCSCGESCQGGLACVLDRCVRDPSEVVLPPEEPKCYTPCRDDLVHSDGTVVRCDSHGLLPGCVDGLVCTDGSCIPGGAPPPEGSPAAGCSSDTDCPDFQACLRGKCYSACDVDADCPDPLICFRHSCRLPCVIDAASCPGGRHCVSDDGTSGHCEPLSDEEPDSQPLVDGTFELSTHVIELSNTTTGATFSIVNNGTAPQELTVQKLRHTEFTTGSSVVDDETPLFWVSIGPPGQEEQVNELKIVVAAGSSAEVSITNGANPNLARWDGTLSVSARGTGKQVVDLSYQERPDGQWTGKMYFMANFGDTGLDDWIAAGRPKSPSNVDVVPNALIRQWSNYRHRQINYGELQAMILATVTGSWSFQGTRDQCDLVGGACFLVENGVKPFTESLVSYPVPSGISELPLAVNLALDPKAPMRMTGRIESSVALQYAGNPALTLTLGSSPLGCPDASDPTCRIDVTDLSAEIVVGGRYAATGSCAPDFQKVSVPWLVPKFEQYTVEVSSTGRDRPECRDSRFPFGTSSEALNANFALSNPVPDGRTRRRRLELVDGFLVNQRELHILFRERFDSFLGDGDSDGFSAYGYIKLERSPANLTAESYQGSTPPSHADAPSQLSLECSKAMVEKVLGNGGTLTARTASTVAKTLLGGVPAGSRPTPLCKGNWAGQAYSGPQECPYDTGPYVHFLCVDTGQFDGGSNSTTSCPAESDVLYFVWANADLGTDAQCNSDASCFDTLQAWIANPPAGFNNAPLGVCTDENAVRCDFDRIDPRKEKTFYLPSDSTGFLPLSAEVEQAFRYRTRFRSRSGTGLGFTPQVCVPNSDEIPYCYDPEAIEKLRERVDCLIHIYVDPTLRSGLDPSTDQPKLRSYLIHNFSQTRVNDPIQGTPVTFDGFERLYAELLVMLGDEGYTSSFAARLDLAGTQLRDFPGSRFEPNGIDLSGPAGFEMYNLYQASQYHQLALDRFYALSPTIWTSLNTLGVSRGFITQKTVTSYFQRLIGASTHKSRAWSESARRYMDFNRPDLARTVVERAYTATYMEAVVLARMMLRVLDIADPKTKDQISAEVDRAALTYRAVLLDMRDVYASISDDPLVFGFPPEYIPFPALDPADANAFDKLFASAQDKGRIAAQKEREALQSSREFNVDEAVFQQELTSLKNNYENELSEICGTFTGSDGQVRAATPNNADYDSRARLLGDPCGLMGTGSIHQAVGEIELATLDVRAVKEQHATSLLKLQSSETTYNEICQKAAADAAYEIEYQGKAQTLRDFIAAERLAISRLNSALQIASSLSNLIKCAVGTSSDCPTAAMAAVGFGVTSAAIAGLKTVSELVIHDHERDLAALALHKSVRETHGTCESAGIAFRAQVRDQAIESHGFLISALRAALRLKLALSNVEQLRNKAKRLMVQQQEALALEINKAAARNDPNVRIYKNDAVVTADRTFRIAVAEAYKATRVFEYYTGQSYARKDNLFLVRMITAGNPFSLEEYLEILDAEFVKFEESFGNPDTRVVVLSMRDDVMQIPYVGPDATAISHSERVTRMRTQLADTRLLDQNGYLTLPFSTNLDRLSPITWNHKIKHIEAEIVGSNIGDATGRVYLRQKGTNTVRMGNGDPFFYAFPERTAVINPFFNGVRQFDPAVYRNERLRDRPYANAMWELVFNQRDEVENQDVSLASLTDIRLYVYYTDFTGE